MGARRRAREVALQALYQMDLRGETDVSEVETAVRAGPGDGRSKETGLDWARRAWAMRIEADDLASETAADWPSERQPAVDRAILRLAYWELQAGRPPPVVINEAIELAKRYSTDRSAKFVNGVLDRMRGRIGPSPTEAGDAPQAVSGRDPGDPWLEDALSDPAVGGERSPDGPPPHDS